MVLAIIDGELRECNIVETSADRTHCRLKPLGEMKFYDIPIAYIFNEDDRTTAEAVLGLAQEGKVNNG